MQNPLFSRLCFFASILALVVIVLGAYTRLTDAGLGCPDWPGCYGTLTVPSHQIALTHSPDIPLETKKAWTEMVHRYFAGSLGLLILALFIGSWIGQKPGRWLLTLLLLLVIFQALLGMWTVTLKLHPLVVMAHLLGGLAILGLLWWTYLRSNRERYFSDEVPNSIIKKAAILGLLLLGLQIALGGWTSANYAALACPDFPTCQTQWWPSMNFKEAYALPFNNSPWNTSKEMNYAGGVLHNEARTTIHMMHRLGALIVFVYLFLFSLLVLKKSKLVPPRGLPRGEQTISNRLFKATWVVLSLLVIQIILGISNIIFLLPLPIAVAHNAGAALLLLSMITIIYFCATPPSHMSKL